MAEEIIRISQFESKAVVALETRSAGVYYQKLSTAGNSILSTVFVESLDGGASLDVEYFDFGVGGDAGEAFPLNFHDTISTPVTSSRRLISNAHDKPYLKCTVTGGNVRFGVYATVVLSSASDVDNALQLDGETVLLPSDKGIPIVIYDVDDGEWRFARGDDGIQNVKIVGNVVVGEPGDPLFVDAIGTTTPGIEQTLISYVVPAGKTLNILNVVMICRIEATWKILGDSSQIGSARTGAAMSNVNFPYRVARSYTSGKLIEVKATARSGSSAADIECYLQGTLS
jgi:hypothetical protein